MVDVAFSRLPLAVQRVVLVEGVAAIAVEIELETQVIGG